MTSTFHSTQIDGLQLSSQSVYSSSWKTVNRPDAAMTYMSAARLPLGKFDFEIDMEPLYCSLDGDENYVRSFLGIGSAANNTIGGAASCPLGTRAIGIGARSACNAVMDLKVRAVM